MPLDSELDMKYFGTDGLRGRVGDHMINPGFFVRLGWALGDSLPPPTGSARRKVIIGKDTRVSGYMLETALESGLIASGVDVLLLGPIPTPGVAYLTQSLKASMGIMISASHNPYYDNGVKIFDAQGQKLPVDWMEEVERRIDSTEHNVVESVQLGKATRINEASGRYIERCRQLTSNQLDLGGIRMVVDCAHGATYKVAPLIFKELGADVKAINVSPDGININDECGSTHAEAVRREVLADKADIGISFDGDGDRLLVVDRKGRLLNGDRLLYIIATDMLMRGGKCNGVVGTEMSNTGLEYGLREYQIPFARAEVGDSNVSRVMRNHNWMLGGEPSGHIICVDRSSTGDGVVAALRLLEAMISDDRDIGDWAYQVDYFDQAHRNVAIASQGYADGTGDAMLKTVRESDTYRNIEEQISKKLKPSRILLRASGTEPLLRLMVEGRDKDKVNKYADQLANTIEGIV